MLSMLTPYRKTFSGSEARVPSARHAPLNASSSAMREDVQRDLEGVGVDHTGKDTGLRNRKNGRIIPD